MTEKYAKIGKLSISEKLLAFINNEAIPGTSVNQKKFWSGFDEIVHKLQPLNKELINTRRKLQLEIDRWHLNNKKKKFDVKKYKKFLQEIGYLVKEGNNFKIKTSNLDEEISKIAGPQLVVPITNARYVLNAANARYQSLYDSLYGTDVIQSLDSVSERYDPERGAEVIKFTKNFLDLRFPLVNGSWKSINKIYIKNNELKLVNYKKETTLKNFEKFIGFRGNKEKPEAIILKNNNLHVEIIINPYAFSARSDPAGISDIIVESAITTICDHEDSVACVDAQDKIEGYRNWLGLMKGDLKTKFEKKGKFYIRKLNPDRKYISKDGVIKKLKGRALLLNRNNGHLMTNPSVLLKDGSEIPEGILDAFITSLCSLHDIESNKNSKQGSIMIVKPKQHGPDECSFTDLLFGKVEELLKLKKNTIKCGIMDEERRTSLNLKECIRRLENRVFFINTGFLDRTGDEIHTSMEAGAMVPKSEMKSQSWINAYEDWNVDIGISCGLSGKAQIGKGMWAMPDEMKEMVETKIAHPLSGATCAWVPSPTAATLHAMHYHQVDVLSKQDELSSREQADLDKILTIPLLKKDIDKQTIRSEIANSAQGILGYVVRWIDQGIGCSKVPDINNIGLMEDRATCRISSQHISNWIHHGICSEEEVIDIFKEMALVVDEQNKEDPNYQKIGPNFSGFAFQASLDLVIKGAFQPSGYTEPLLHKWRLEFKKNTP